MRTLKSAQKHLNSLEAQAAANQPQLDIFSTLYDVEKTNIKEPAAETTAESNQVLDALAEINPDALTPREALDILYHLKKMT